MQRLDPSILNEKDEATRRHRLVDWHVECAVHTATRRQSSIGLAYVRGKDRDTSEISFQLETGNVATKC